MNTLLLILVIFILICFNFGTENFTGLAAIAGAGTDQCSMQCRVSGQDLVDPENCCLCKTSDGYVTGPKDSENEPFRKCMCSLGSGYESYCYKLSTNFLLSQ